MDEQTRQMFERTGSTFKTITTIVNTHEETFQEVWKVVKLQREEIEMLKNQVKNINEALEAANGIIQILIQQIK